MPVRYNMRTSFYSVLVFSHNDNRRHRYVKPRGDLSAYDRQDYRRHFANQPKHRFRRDLNQPVTVRWWSLKPPKDPHAPIALAGDDPLLKQQGVVKSRPELFVPLLGRKLIAGVTEHIVLKRNHGVLMLLALIVLNFILRIVLPYLGAHGRHLASLAIPNPLEHPLSLSAVLLSPVEHLVQIIWMVIVVVLYWAVTFFDVSAQWKRLNDQTPPPGRRGKRRNTTGALRACAVAAATTNLRQLVTKTPLTAHSRQIVWWSLLFCVLRGGLPPVMTVFAPLAALTVFTGMQMFYVVMALGASIVMTGFAAARAVSSGDYVWSATRGYYVYSGTVLLLTLWAAGVSQSSVVQFLVACVDWAVKLVLSASLSYYPNGYDLLPTRVASIVAVAFEYLHAFALFSAALTYVDILLRTPWQRVTNYCSFVAGVYVHVYYFRLGVSETLTAGWLLYAAACVIVCLYAISKVYRRVAQPIPCTTNIMREHLLCLLFPLWLLGFSYLGAAPVTAMFEFLLRINRFVLFVPPSIAPEVIGAMLGSAGLLSVLMSDCHSSFTTGGFFSGNNEVAMAIAIPYLMYWYGVHVAVAVNVFVYVLNLLFSVHINAEIISRVLTHQLSS
eukprot:TRINITY_DN8502_c0_g2_i2.p1 TRINITY_DN8502_c0_g2~~TRINITY_DN8502_c0_g2_i2.p1  ORF type:complete len:612 (-),score=102.93 TRINITY_DN8502_c0_g2_i2:231-2066(-)